MSAKYGLLSRGDLISPYDKQISDLTVEEVRSLVSEIRTQLAQLPAVDGASFTSLCIPEYTEVLRMAECCPQQATLAFLPKEQKHVELRSLTDPRSLEGLLDSTYEVISRLVSRRPLVPFREAVRQDMPVAGIYIFFDTNERRLRQTDGLRVVRVGTHGVASGSKATLKDRLRTHFGTSAGGGNHRSSIFRLHVGRSMIRAGLQKDVKGWGGTAMPTSDRLRRMEERLETAVSEYIGNLLVATLDVPGLSAKDNDRAYLEQNLIALFSNFYAPLDPPSHVWLGNHSEKAEVRKSGLWNVNHTAQNVDPRFIDLLKYYVNLTVGDALGAKPEVDKDWIASARADARQLNLF